jgi:hypothetical protein
MATRPIFLDAANGAHEPTSFLRYDAQGSIGEIGRISDAYEAKRGCGILVPRDESRLQGGQNYTSRHVFSQDA